MFVCLSACTCIEVAKPVSLFEPRKAEDAVEYFGKEPAAAIRNMRARSSARWRVSSFVGQFPSHTRQLVPQKYRITKRVGGGSFGDIYLGVGANGEKVRSRVLCGKLCRYIALRDVAVHRPEQRAVSSIKILWFCLGRARSNMVSFSTQHRSPSSSKNTEPDALSSVTSTRSTANCKTLQDLQKCITLVRRTPTISWLWTY